jgi:Mg-chelatase subunit ChlD
LTEGGATNFHDGFQVAFDALERTIRQESTSGCNVAILFMTDGINTAGPDTDETLTLINKWTRRLANLYDRDTKIFTFSLGTQADRTVTKKIACSTNGIWTPVDDFDDDLVSAMSSYYKLFSNGLGDDTNFSTAWVEPYEFFTGK